MDRCCPPERCPALSFSFYLSLSLSLSLSLALSLSVSPTPLPSGRLHRCTCLFLTSNAIYACLTRAGTRPGRKTTKSRYAIYGLTCGTSREALAQKRLCPHPI